MATATNTRSYAARSPVPGRVLVALAALVAAALIVTLVDGDDGGSPAPAAAVQAPAAELTAAQAASAARLAGMAATGSAATGAASLAAAPSDIWDFRTFGASGPVPVVRPFDIVSGDIPTIVPFDRPVVAEIWERPDVAGGEYDAFAAPPAASAASVRQELR